jgi:hypothetical protein
MVFFEYDIENPDGLSDIIVNYGLVNAGKFDVCILGSSRKPVIFKNGIHVWIKTSDEENSNLMIILSFILIGHPDWKNADIKIFDICKENETEKEKKKMEELIEKGRLPITSQSIKILIEKDDISYKSIINEYSSDAALTIIGFRGDSLKKFATKAIERYENLGNTLFVNSYKSKEIE